MGHTLPLVKPVSGVKKQNVETNVKTIYNMANKLEALPKGTILKVIDKILLTDCTIPITLDREMKYLPRPLVADELVIVMEDVEEGQKYAKVRHNKGKWISTFDRQWMRKLRKKAV